MSVGHAHALFVDGHSRVHRLPAHVKLVALVVFVVAVVATPREMVGAFALDAGLVSGAAAAAHLRPRSVAGRMLIGAPVLAGALLLPVVGAGARVDAGGLWLSLDGLWGAWSVIAKGTISLAASIVVTATTPVPEMLAGLTILRAPAVVTAIAGFMVRYLEVIAGELRRTRVAMASRGYQPTFAWQVGPIAASVGALFIRSHERGERVYDAMVSRGYQGRLPQLSASGASSRDWVWALVLPLCAAAAATLAVIA